MPFTTNNPTSCSNGTAINKILCAAVVNSKFCKLLLSDPTRALASGFNGETFRLSKDERDQILAIRAHNLADFAKQLIENQNSQHVLQPVSIRADIRAYATVGLD